MRGGKRIVLAVTADVSLKLTDGFPETLATSGWDVHIVCSPGPNERLLGGAPGIHVHSIEMERNPSPASDLRALVQWVRLLHILRPDVTTVSTPKAGLIGEIAAALIRVAHRVYTLHGLRYETSSRLARQLLGVAERAACACAHDVLAVSPSLREVAVADRLLPREKAIVLGGGSSNGVDLERFACSREERRNAKAGRWPDAPDVPVIGFVGRIHPDKGFELLAAALAILSQEECTGRLLVVGGSDHLAGETLKALLVDSGFDVEFTGAVDDVAPFLRMMDILCLPTKREGFGNVVIEAAAAGIPTVATAATGVIDAIVDGQTGLICPSRDPADLAHMLRSLIESEDRRTKMGEAARVFVESHFARSGVWQDLLNSYNQPFRMSQLPRESLGRSRRSGTAGSSN